MTKFGSKMWKRQIFVLGLLSTLGMLSFIIGVWNGMAIKTKHKPEIRGYEIENTVKSQIVKNMSSNRSSRGLQISLQEEDDDQLLSNRVKVQHTHKEYLRDEFIDIPKITQSTKAKRIHKGSLRNRNTGKRIKPKLHRTPFPEPIFSFKAMGLPKSSLNYPFTYAKILIKYRLLLEYRNETDLHETILKKRIPVEELLPKVKSDPMYIDVSNNDKNASLRLGDYVNPSKALHILVATSWRSGSTFLGDLLSRYPGAFYSFEPIHYIDHKNGFLQDITEKETESLNLVSQIFKCQPDSGYFIHANKPENRFLFRHNFRLWNICENLLMAGAACFMPELYRSTCPIFPIRVIKTVRLRVEATEKLLNDPVVGKTLKIVVLVRDPRGVMNSRAGMDWCKLPHCIDPATVCRDLQSDILAAYKIKKDYPDRIHLIRYEDLSIDPFGTIDNMLRFLGLPPHKLIETYIEKHTQATRSSLLSTTTNKIATSPGDEKELQDKATPYNTSRNSRATVFSWKKRMKYKDILKVQRVCRKPMRMLGYNPMSNISRSRKDDNFPLIVKSPQELWSTSF